MMDVCQKVDVATLCVLCGKPSQMYSVSPFIPAMLPPPRCPLRSHKHSTTKTDLMPEVIAIYYKVCVVGARDILF